MAYKDYDANEFFNGLYSDAPANKSGYQEHDPNDFLNSLDKVSPKQAQSFWEKPKQILKGAEYIAKPFGSDSIMTSESVKNLGKGIASLADNAYGVIPATASYVTQPFARLFTSPERAKEIADQVGSAIDKPIGKAFGITQDPAYQNEASSRGMQYAGQKMDQLASYASEKTGLPKEDLEHMIASGTFLATHGANAIAKPIIGSAADQLKNKFNEYRDVAVNGPKPIQEPVFGFADNPELIKPREPIVQVEAAPAEFNNTQPLSVIKVQPENRAQTNPFTPSEINERRALLNKIGLEDHRQSALEGNPKESASQFITSQADQGPYASGMTEQINKEKSVLDNHFDKIAKESGGTQVRYNDPVFQESDKIKAGTTIKDALQESYDQHKAQTADLYKEATQKLGNRPVSLDNFNNFINADENFAYQNEKGLQSGIKQFMNRSGYLDEAGNVKPLTVAQAEDVRQYINSKYHHETKQLGGQLKGLIDNDVFETVGGETYEKARNHYITGNDVYNNPKAMGDLLGDNGVNEKIPDEKVLPKISALPNKQFEHLFNTLNDNGKTNATNQIKTALVEQIKQAGSSAKNQPFNSVAASNEAAKLSQKLRVAFADDPQALQSIYDGIKAADILHIPTKYPGAAVQDNLLKNKFSEAAIQRAGEVIGAGAGGWLGGTPGGALGGAAGGYLGEKGASAAKKGRQVKQLEKEIPTKSKLSDLNKYSLEP